MNLNRITKIVLFGTFLSLSCNSLFSQNTNTLLPYGNVGIGTLLPTAKLQVKGSTLLQTLTVTEGALFKDNLTIDKQLTVLGKSLLNEINVAGVLKLRATTLLQAVTPDFQVLLKDPLSGDVVSTSLGELNRALYGTGCLVNGIGTGGDSEKADGISLTTPIWESKPGVLFVDCPNELRVGIGTEYPEFQLESTGTVRFPNAVIGAVTPSSVQGYLHIKSSLQASNKATVFFVENDQKKLLQLNNAGSLALGNIAPTDSKGLLHLKYNAANVATDLSTVMLVENNGRRILELHNNGLLHAREVLVDDAPSWPDYVFDPSYALLPLETVKAYIDENHHLPGVKPACEIEENGINIGETSTVLMEKVEELTLYMIQLQEQLKTQQALLLKQQQLIEQLSSAQKN